MRPIRGLLLLSTMLIVSCGGERTGNRVNAPDLILLNARVVTMDDNDTIAEAIAVSGRTIAAIGTTVEVRALAGPATETIDLDGNSVTPGIIDTHNHFAYGASTDFNQVDLEFPAVRRVADVRERLRQEAARKAPDEWILGWGWDAAKLEENRDLVAADIDDVTPDNPVWLGHASAHYGVANARALALAGIGPDTPDPAGGVIARDDQGNPTGVLADQAMGLVDALIPDAGGNLAAAVAAYTGDLSREGITAIKDPEIDESVWDAYRAVARDGALSVRVFTLWRAPDTVAEAESLLARIAPMTRPGEQDDDELVRSIGVKIYIDGSGTARTAWMYDDWNIGFDDVDEGNAGLTYLEPDVLFDQVRLFHDAGIHIGTHAIGDRAIDFTMDAYAHVLDDNPVPGLRHSIIHCNLPTDHAMDLMARLQRDFDAGYPEVQPAFLWWIGDAYAGNFGPGRSRRVLPLRTFERRGIRWAGASDYDVSPYAPRYAFWAASVREPMLGTYGRQPWGTDESVPIQDSLRAYTATAARQVFMEDRIGTLEVGKLADIVAWDRDLHAVPVDELKDVSPVLTLMNGKVVFRAPAAY